MPNVMPLAAVPDVMPPVVSHTNHTNVLIPDGLVDALKKTRDEREFLNLIPSNTLAYVDLKTLHDMSKHLIARETRKPSKRKPSSTLLIMKHRKRIKNGGNSKKSKMTRRCKQTDLAERVLADIRQFPELVNMFSFETQTLIKTLL